MSSEPPADHHRPTETHRTRALPGAVVRVRRGGVRHTADRHSRFGRDQHLAIGQRVEVRAIGSRRDIVAQAGGGDTGWLAVTAGATFAGSSLYVRKVGDFVTLRGQADRTTGNVTSGDVVCTLDAAYRPATSRSFTGNGSGSALAKMVIASSGIITVSSAPSATTTYIRLDSGNYSID